ncbi:AMP-binding protein [Pseudoalteromonas sp. SMS1]|uniref:fatty acyl-AMP ligase n=1 Tax=Pseudoalteromonas sp. SMS1 TaxID=2908894 RepID=UPI001F2D742F|nr:fatty acyl-AMP ligase [Pseudoalteromonas sp. SMS1]MCF2857590.1 AMP-binding protein [Pseudoalteromonas sp. SMS1]
MRDVKNIIECLQKNALEKPDEVAYEFIVNLDLPTKTITYGQLFEDVTQIAKNLLLRVEPGDCVLLLFPPSIDYIKAFFACVIAGVVAIPLYPPKKNSKSDKVFTVAKASQARFALTTEKELPLISQFWSENSEVAVKFVSTDELEQAQGGGDISLPNIDKDKPAFLQYTSGSTGNPKGVIITQGNILANTKYLERLSGAHEKDVFVNWLPLFHDLGLVTTILLPAYLGCKSVLMAPATFVRNPIVWFKAMTQFGGTIGGAPNFAFDLCTDKISDGDLADIDLSQWRIAYNAAEPVKYETLRRFSARFASVGFNQDSFYPSYGMAESTAFITGGHGDDKLATISISKKALAENQVQQNPSELEDQVTFVGNGLTDREHSVKIVDGDKRDVVAEGVIGEVWFSGPSVSPGYWLLDEVSKEAFGNQLPDTGDTNYLNTGDLGFIVDNQLFITGRKKDIIILKGKNYYPQDIEATIKYCHNDIHPGYTTAFEANGQLVVVTEVKRTALSSLKPELLLQEMARSVYEQHSVSIDDIVLIPPYKIPMTSSGKVRRKATKERYLTGQLPSLFQKQQSEQVTAPENDIEIAVHKIWSECLAQASICVKRGFYELGGDSIKALEIVDKVQQKYKSLRLDENKVLECASIREMSQLIALEEMKNARTNNLSGAIKL